VVKFGLEMEGLLCSQAVF